MDRLVERINSKQDQIMEKDCENMEKSKKITDMASALREQQVELQSLRSQLTQKGIFLERMQRNVTS